MLAAFEADHLSSDNWVLIIEYSSSVAGQPTLRQNLAEALGPLVDKATKKLYIYTDIPTLLQRFIHKNIVLGESAGTETVGVMTKAGTPKYKRWLGFIDVEAAKRLPHALPVKLEAARWSVQ